MKLSLMAGLFLAALRAQTASEAEIRDLLEERIDKLHQNVGIAVGIIDQKGRAKRQ
jgi:hypothetical protein